MPRPGDLSVVTDWSGAATLRHPHHRVEVVAFDEVAVDFAATEGEGDGSLAYWRQAHRAAFSRELEGIGALPRPDTPVVCERFEVVFPV